MATKFQDYFERMIETQKEMFDSFAVIHQQYSQDPDKYQDLYNKEGIKILKIIHEWETKLCSQSEKAGYGYATEKLSEKFMQLIRQKFPLIDYIGIISKKEPKFGIKRISLKTS